MNNSKLIHISIILLMLGSCKQKKSETNKFKVEEIKISNFYEKTSLKSEPTGIKTISSGNIGLAVIDTFLIIQKNTEPFIEVYSTNTNKLITTYGKYGEGPGYILDPLLVRGTEIINDQPIFTIFDLTKRIINKVNLNNLINNIEPILTQETVPFTGEHILYYYYSDDEIILTKTEGNNRFIHYNYENETTKNIPIIPKQNFEIDEYVINRVYRSSVTVNKQKGIIAAFPILLGSIDFFDINGNYLHTTYFDDPKKLENNLIYNTEPRIYIRDSDSDENFIYGLNINNSNTEIHGSTPNKLKIEVFDWDGNPIKEFILENDEPSEAMAFDSKHNRFYTYCRDCESSNILIFNIK